MAIGKRIQEIAKEQGLSLKELATRAEVPYTTLYSMVKRDSNKTDYDTLHRLAHALNVAMWTLGNFDTIVTEKPEGEERLLYAFDQLNESGQAKAVERVEELTEIPKYQKKPSSDESEDG